MRTTVGALPLVTGIGVALLGCSCGAPAATSGGGTSTTVTAAAASADYEVHEWGLLRAEAGDVLRAGVIAPPMTAMALSVDKPVLYFHSPSALTLASVTVQMPDGGRIAEAWPLVPFGETARWENVALSVSGACTPSPLPSATQAPCAQLGPQDQCESASLNVVRTSDAACVTVGAATEQFLFYRAQSSRFTPPLVFERTHVYEQVEVRNEGDAPIPGLLVRLWSDGFRTRALAVAPPAPHASVVVGNDFEAAATVAADEDSRSADHPVQADDVTLPPSTVGPARRAIAETMLGLGLTQPEADAFLSAWSSALFTEGGSVPMDVLTDRRGLDGMDGDLAPRESFLYFLPEVRTDEIAELSFDPPPRAVHRAMAVWSPIRSTGASH
jgi:hypothetical protein